MLEAASSNGLLRVTPDDPEYQRLARAEADYWQQPHPYGLEAHEKKGGETCVDLNANERYTGDARVPWQDTICRYGVFRRGLLLGTSALKVEARILETNPSLHLTCLDISPEAVARRRDALGGIFPGRVETVVADMNFLELNPHRYDLIVSSACIHHVTNMEHLAFQMNRGLTEGGYAFVQDYVGEPRFQFAPEKKRVFELLHDREARSTGRPGVRLRWMDASDLSPFCGVRSDEVLGVLGRYLEQVQVHTAGALTIACVRARPSDVNVEGLPKPGRFTQARHWLEDRLRSLARLSPRYNMIISREFFQQLLDYGDLLADAGILQPGNAFGVYRKRPAPTG